MNYPSNNRYNGPRNYGGQAGPRQGGNRRGRYEPGKATLRPNHEKRGERDPDYKGVVTIDKPGVYFISGWLNRYEDGNEAIGLRMSPADASPGQGRPQYQQQRPAQQDYRPGNGYQQQRPMPQREGNGAYAPGGAMSRARPVPPQQYREEGPYDNAPPPNAYPENADGYNIEYPDDEPVPY